MTTRPPLASVGRPIPQRSLSTTHANPRPAAHSRTFSQQYTASSPTKRSNEAFSDLSADGDASQGRPRIGMSRLREEISTDAQHLDIVDSPTSLPDATPTWRPSFPPRGRPQLHSDVRNVGNNSGRTAQEGGQQDVQIKPMPLPVRPGYHLPESIKKLQSSPIQAGKKDTRPKPYNLEVPAAAPHYSPNGMYALFY